MFDGLPWDHPRLRGNNWYSLETIVRRLGSPPLAREQLSCGQAAIYPDGITPACAGTTMPGVMDDIITRDHPRLRGNNVSRNLTCTQLPGSPPLAREQPS